MQRMIQLAGLMVLSACISLAADKTMTGKIADSLCGAHHNATAEHGKQISDRDCTLACINKGGKYVFVDENNKVYAIENQDFKGLKQNAGMAVKVTGDVENDMITISKLQPAGKSTGY